MPQKKKKQKLHWTYFKFWIPVPNLKNLSFLNPPDKQNKKETNLGEIFPEYKSPVFAIEWRWNFFENFEPIVANENQT